MKAREIAHELGFEYRLLKYVTRQTIPICSHLALLLRKQNRINWDDKPKGNHRLHVITSCLYT